MSLSRFLAVADHTASIFSGLPHTMTSKTISTGTLGLRFMQNAMRRQQLQEVEHDRADVQDEGKWEVGREVKEAWGIGKGNSQNDAVVYENSYLPFLFSSEIDDTSVASSSSKPLGRRMFDKRGQDVSTSKSQVQNTQREARDDNGEAEGDEGEESEEGEVTVPSQGALKSEDKLSQGRRLKVHAKPIALTSLPAGRGLKGFDTLEPSNVKEQQQRGSERKKGKSAKQMIFDMSGVGTDLRTTRDMGRDEDSGEFDNITRRKEQGQGLSQGFLKPAGVDEPTRHGDKPPALPNVINGARKKRNRDPNDPNSEEKKKKKKKKQGVVAE